MSAYSIMWLVNDKGDVHMNVMNVFVKIGELNETAKGWVVTNRNGREWKVFDSKGSAIRHLRSLGYTVESK